MHEEFIEINKEKMKGPRMPGIRAASLTSLCPMPVKNRCLTRTPKWPTIDKCSVFPVIKNAS